MRLCGFEDAQHSHGPAKEEQSAAVGGNVLVRTGAEAEEVAELVVTSAGLTRLSTAGEWLVTIACALPPLTRDRACRTIRER